MCHQIMCRINDTRGWECNGRPLIYAMTIPDTGQRSEHNATAPSNNYCLQKATRLISSPQSIAADI